VPSLGFGYPFDGVSSKTLESLFQLSTFLGLSLRSFFLASDRATLFPRTLPFLRFPNKPFEPVTGAPTALSRLASCTPQCSQSFSSGRGHGSLGIPDLLGSPLIKVASKRLSLRLPFHPLNLPALPRTDFGILGYPTLTPWLSPFVKGAGPFGLSHRLSCATFLG